MLRLDMSSENLEYVALGTFDSFSKALLLAEIYCPEIGT